MNEEYGEEDYEAMLQPFKDAFSALGTEQIDRWALKEIFEALGNQITSEEEFEQQFQDIDTDGVRYHSHINHGRTA
jgi:Ca2+-binding EF-hand superfamily protein